MTEEHSFFSINCIIGCGGAYALFLIPSIFVHFPGMKTFFCPCWTLSKVASVATNRHVCKYLLNVYL